MSKWKEYKLGEIIQLIGGGTPKTSVPEYWDGDISWLSVGDFNNVGKYVYSAEKKITKLGLENSSTKILHKDDIIISARGTVGVVAMIGRDMAFNQSCYGIRNKDIVDKHFLYYLIINSINSLKQNAYGGVFDTITRETFDLIDVSLPSFDEQCRIASILTSLDDKIDLLRRENATLEAMAETLFRELVLDKENNGTLEQIMSIQNGYAFKSKDFKDTGIHKVIKIRNISDSIVNIDTTDYVDSNAIIGLSSKFKINSGDILIAMTGAEIGKLGIIPKNNNSLWLNQRVGLLVEKFKGSKYLAYLQLKSDYGQDHIENTATGSAQPNISGTGIEKCGFPIFKQEDLIHISMQIGELYDKIIFNLGQANVLKETRDYLLPKLMSNEIKVII